MDIVYIGATIALFIVSWAFAAGCQKLRGTP
jgi:hypothetical protein